MDTACGRSIIRWTVGPVHPAGFYCLRVAISSMRKLYGDTVRYAICYNQLTTQQIALLPTVDLLIDQATHAAALPCAPPSSKKTCGPAWKLYPPRLDINVHEIVLDNDVVIYQIPPAFDKFFSRTDTIVVTQALARSYSGPLAHSIPTGFNINSGVMCFPPGYNFGAALQPALVDYQWVKHFDEQTLVAATLAKHPRVEIIPLRDIHVCFNSYGPGRYGQHFVTLNNGRQIYWKQFCRPHKH